jgi:hypothetical protein
MSKSKIVKVSLFLIVAAVIAVVALVHAAYEFRKDNPSIFVLTGADSSIDTVSLKFRIGQTTLNIPRNYFFSAPSVATYLEKDMKWHPSIDKEEVGFTVELMLPNYNPRTKENQAVFNKAFGQKLLVQVQNHSHNLTGKKLFDQFYNDKNSTIGGDIIFHIMSCHI